MVLSFRSNYAPMGAMLTIWQISQRRRCGEKEKRFSSTFFGRRKSFCFFAWGNYYYLYRNLLILIFGVFSNGRSMSSTFAIWL